QQGPRIRRRGEAPAVPRRRRLARFEVSPRAGLDRRIQLPVSRRARDAHGGPHGPRAGHGEEPGSDRRRYRGQRARGEGRGSRSQWRLRGGPEGEEVTPMPTVDVVNLSNSKVGELELADKVFAAEVNTALLYAAV